MKTCERSKALFVGVDVHKDTHTAVGLSPFGEVVFEKTLGNYESDFASLVRSVEECAREQNLAPFFGLEDVHGYGERLARAISKEGYSVTYVPPVLVDRQRAHATHPEKNDTLDAKGVAKVMIQRIDTLPAYIVSEEGRTASVLKELSQDREFLVVEQTRIKNQLHTILHRIWNTAYREKFKNPFSVKALQYWMRSVPKSAPSFLVRSMKRKVKRLQAIREEIKELEAELESIMAEHEYTLATASGCGTVLAATIIGEIGDINRFASPAALAKYAGCAPKEHSSGKTVRWRKSRGGNRRLNCALFRMALSQISGTGNEKARAYFKRKVSEGKSKSQALVCLRRQMVAIVWMMMKHKTTYDACWKKNNQARAALSSLTVSTQHPSPMRSTRVHRGAGRKKRSAVSPCDALCDPEMAWTSREGELQANETVCASSD